MSTDRTIEKSNIRRGAAVAALVAAGLLHAFITPEYVAEKLYIGLLFGLSVPLCFGTALWLSARSDRLAWATGAVLSLGMIAGFLLSRTVGLPGFNESGVWAHWTEGFPALSAELGFLFLAIPELAPSRVTPSTLRTTSVKTPDKRYENSH